MRISLLGELEVFDDDGTAVVITGAKQRALLAMLALHPGQMVPADQLVEALVGRAPAAGGAQRPAGAGVEVASSARVRRACWSCAAAATSLDVAPDAVDVHRFEQLVAQGRAAAANGDLADAVALLGEADALWRGDGAGRVRLRGLRLGRHRSVVGAAAGGDRGAARGRAGARPSRRRRRAGGAGRRASAPRAAAGTADAGALPRRAPGRGAAGRYRDGRAHPRARSWASTPTPSCGGWRRRSSPRIRRSTRPAVPSRDAPAPTRHAVQRPRAADAADRPRRRGAASSPRSPASTASLTLVGPGGVGKTRLGAGGRAGRRCGVERRRLPRRAGAGRRPGGGARRDHHRARPAPIPAGWPR